MTDDEQGQKIDKLLDAIDLVKADRKDAAYPLLRDLIREDNNFEDAWLWMSVAVDSVDESTICLDNVLRVNPANTQAAGALYRLRETEIRIEKTRTRLIVLRDSALAGMWILTIALLYTIVLTYAA